MSGCIAGFLVSVEMVLNFLFSYSCTQTKVTKLENQTTVY